IGLVRGELDWVVMKCLEKDRTRRYESASALARDIERYLNEEPVEACPPSAAYRLRKFAQRNRRLLATSEAFFVLVLLGAAVSIWLAVRATVEKHRADEEAAVVHAVNQFLQNDLLDQADIANQPTGLERSKNITVRELLDRASQRIGTRFKGQEKT